MNTIIGELGKSQKFIDLSNQIEKETSPISISGLTSVGMTENQVKNILGEPENCSYSENMIGTKMSTFAYENMTIMFEQKNSESYIVTGIYSNEKNKVGPRGIKLGDSMDNVISKFYSDKNVEYNDDYTVLYSKGEYISGTINTMDGEKNISYFNENMTLDIHLGEDNKVVMMSLTINN